jgi:hypothetical protein
MCGLQDRCRDRDDGFLWTTPGLEPQVHQQWAVGGGLRIIAPTGPDDITSGKWQMMPIVGARTMLPELSTGSYFEGVVRYDFSFAGDPTKKNISNLQLWPMLNIGLPDQWFFTLYPSADIRVNYGDPVTGQTGRLFLPFDFRHRNERGVV